MPVEGWDPFASHGLARRTAPEQLDSEDSAQLSHFLNDSIELSSYLKPHLHRYSSGYSPQASPKSRSTPITVATSSSSHYADDVEEPRVSVGRRISWRQYPSSKMAELVEIPKRVSSKPSMVSSNRSSLSYGGDLTLDLGADSKHDFPWNARASAKIRSSVAGVNTPDRDRTRCPEGSPEAKRIFDLHKTSGSIRSVDSFVSAKLSPPLKSQVVVGHDQLTAFYNSSNNLQPVSSSPKPRDEDCSNGLKQPKDDGPPTRKTLPNGSAVRNSLAPAPSLPTAIVLDDTRGEPNPLTSEGRLGNSVSNGSVAGSSAAVPERPQTTFRESPKSQLSGILDLYLALPSPPSISGPLNSPASSSVTQSQRSSEQAVLSSTADPGKLPRRSTRKECSCESDESHYTDGPRRALSLSASARQQVAPNCMHSLNPSRSSFFHNVDLGLTQYHREKNLDEDTGSTTQKLRKWLTKRLSVAGMLDSERIETTEASKTHLSGPHSDGATSPIITLEEFIHSHSCGENEKLRSNSVGDIGGVFRPSQQAMKNSTDLEKQHVGSEKPSELPSISLSNDTNATPSWLKGLSSNMDTLNKQLQNPKWILQKGKPYSEQYGHRESFDNSRDPPVSEFSQKPGSSSYASRSAALNPVSQSDGTAGPDIYAPISSASISRYSDEENGQTLFHDPTRHESIPGVDAQDFANKTRLGSVSTGNEDLASRPATISEHKPAEDRQRFPEPNFIPTSALVMDRNGGVDPNLVPSGFAGTAAGTGTQDYKSMRDSVRYNHQPDVQPRLSSSMFRSRSSKPSQRIPEGAVDSTIHQPVQAEVEDGMYIVEFSNGAINSGLLAKNYDGRHHSIPRDSNYMQNFQPQNVTQLGAGASQRPPRPDWAETNAADDGEKQIRSDAEEKLELREFQKGLRRHHSFRGRMRASLHRTHRKNVLARDWTPRKKRFAAAVACISTALIGLIVGIYAGQVPAIQYAIVDEGTHHAVLGNVFFYLGMMLTTALAWPLPLLYGRKRFTLAGLAILLPLQFPQALVVSQQRPPETSMYQVGLLLPRFLSGLVVGFANMNFWPTLLDLFGSSLQSSSPHQELVDANDPRRHGGGMGMWLGIWTWCHIGSIGLGFLVGAVIIGFINVAWGFWIVIFATLAAMLLNVLAPETRRSVFRRSMAEVRRGSDLSRRVGRGEVMMHLYLTGPLHWWEEARAGIVLNIRMLKQSGFAIMAIYQGWIYGQVVMVMILLGALASRYYGYHPQYVALCVAVFPLGALLAIPFQKASLFSRARYQAQRTDSMTFEKRVAWTSHLVRRMVFMISLPLAAMAYTFSSGGPPVSIAIPVFFAAVIGFLTNLALSECYGLIMETFDVSDLQPGMTGRPRKELSEEVLQHRTNFSCYPRVTSGFALVQTISFGIAAAATAVGGNVERAHGVEAATGIVAGILLGLTLLLVAALTRFRTVQVVPTNRATTAELSGPGDDLPVIIGHPSGTTRRISLLEQGALTRWTEIRRRNKLLGSGRHGRYR